MSRILLAAALAIGCRHTIDSPERPRPADPVSSTDSSVASNAGASPRSNSVASTVRLPSVRPPVPLCLEGVSQASFPRDRLGRATVQCGGGLETKEEPTAWKTAGASWSVIAEHKSPTSICVRFIVIIDPIDRSARVEALDDAARVLARSEGTDMILLPVDGPLCVPEKCTLSIRLATDDAPLTGLVAVLTSA